MDSTQTYTIIAVSGSGKTWSKTYVNRRTGFVRDIALMYAKDCDVWLYEDGVVVETWKALHP